MTSIQGEQRSNFRQVATTSSIFFSTSSLIVDRSQLLLQGQQRAGVPEGQQLGSYPRPPRANERHQCPPASGGREAHQPELAKGVGRRHLRV